MEDEKKEKAMGLAFIKVLSNNIADKNYLYL